VGNPVDRKRPRGRAAPTGCQGSLRRLTGSDRDRRCATYPPRGHGYGSIDGSSWQRPSGRDHRTVAPVTGVALTVSPWRRYREGRSTGTVIHRASAGKQRRSPRKGWLEDGPNWRIEGWFWEIAPPQNGSGYPGIAPRSPGNPRSGRYLGGQPPGAAAQSRERDSLCRPQG